MWVKPSFSDCAEGSASTRAARGRQSRADRDRARVSGRSQVTSADHGVAAGDLWASRHAPVTCDQLAVNQVKVTEVKQWLLNTYSALDRKRSGQCQSGDVLPCILLLSGPAGTGKTECVRCLSRQMSLSLLEWKEPPSEKRHQKRSEHTPDAASDWTLFGREDMDAVSMEPEGQCRRFADFLRRVCRYGDVTCGAGGVSARVGTVGTPAPPGLDDRGRGLLLIDEIPSALIAEKEQLQALLRDFGRRGACPCVIVLTDANSTSSGYSVHSILPENICQELNIHHITFRPITCNQIVKALNRILRLECNSISRLPDRDHIEKLAASAEGDLRSAINSFQFACADDGGNTDICEQSRPTKRARKTTAPSGSNGRKHPECLHSTIGGRDSHLGLFKAIGKILYAKREDPRDASCPVGRCRPALTEAMPAELICAQSGVASDTLLTHLYHNVAQFSLTQPLSLLADALDHLSMADLLSAAEWQMSGGNGNRSGVDKCYSASVGSRGVMFCRVMSVRLGFHQFKQPELTAVLRRRQNRLMEMKDVLSSCWRYSVTQMAAEVLPFLDLLHPSTEVSSPAPGGGSDYHKLPAPQPVEKYLNLYREHCYHSDVSTQEIGNGEYEDFNIEEYHE